MQVIDLKLSEIVIDEDLDFRTNGEDVSELAASITEFGLMQPITVAPPNGDGKHHIIAGRRRLRAFRELGKKMIPAIVNETATGEKAQMIGQIIENLHREDVSPVDEARQFAQLLTYDLKQKDIAKLVGVSAGHISGRLALLKLPERIVKKVVAGDITNSLATKIARLPAAVRDDVCARHTVDERAVASAEAVYKDVKARADMAQLLVDAGLVAVASEDAWGTRKDDDIAVACGLTDDDKPKTHSWDGIGRLHSSNFEAVEDLVAEAVKLAPKGIQVTGTAKHQALVMIGSANLDIAAKKEREAIEAQQAAREKEAQAFDAAWDAALNPILGAPDKAAFIAGMLSATFDKMVGGYGNRVALIERAMSRLDIEFVGLGGSEGETGDEYHERLEAQLREFASKSTTHMIRVLLALTAKNSHGTPEQMLIDQGFMDTFDVSTLDPFTQARLLREGLVDADRVCEDARDTVAAEQAEDAKDEAFAVKVNAKVDALIAARVEEDPETEVSDDERAAMYEELWLTMADDGTVED